MSKNLTRKGLAFGAIVALGTTLFAGAPASAAGIDNGSVSLVPTVGAEYDTLAGAKLAVKANSSSGVTGTGKYLKFQVEDAAGKTSVNVAGSSQYSVATDAGNDVVVTNGSGAAADVATITTATHRLKTGDKVTLAGLDDLAAEYTIPAGGMTVTSTPTATTFTVEFDGADGNGQDAADQDGTVALVASTPDSGKYIFDTKVDTNVATKTLMLASTDEDATQTVIVTAWIDDNDNGAIDTTEYQSPARTIRFLAHGEVTPSVIFNPIAVGSDTTVSARVTLSPVLNGAQLSSADNLSSAAAVLTGNFTRPGSTKTIVADSVSYSDTTKVWTVTSEAMSDNASNNTDATNAAAGWSITQPFDGSGVETLTFVKVTKDVITATTTAAHNLQVGDIVSLDKDITPTWAHGAAVADKLVTVTGVPTTTTFTYAAPTTGTTDAASTAIGGDTSGNVFISSVTVGANHPQQATDAATTVAGTKALRNYAVAGDYSLALYLYKYGTVDALTARGDAVKSSGATVTATAAVVEGVPSATVSKTGNVATGTKTAAFVAKVTDVDGAAVAAGIEAKITATTVTSAGTVKINGTTVTSGSVVYAKTDASGQVAIALENSSALASDSVVLDFTIQGVNAAQVTADWNDRVYSIVDLNDNSVISAPARTRAVAEGASYTFNLLVQDQFKAPAGADLRLKAALTGNTVSTQVVALSAGKASLVVVDGGLSTTADATVSITIEKLTGATWAGITDADGVDWDGNGGELGTVAIKYYTQTDALALNADGANLPSSTTADFSAATTTKAVAAVDARVSNAATPTVVDAGKAVVTGKISNATTGAAKSGEVVSISGSGLLFKSGDVWSIGSASQIAADGTFAFDVYSVNPGTKVVTVTSGSLTKTASLVFTGASSAARVLTISGAQNVLPGSTLQANILLVDGNGNGVDTAAPATTPVSEYIKVSYDGPGLLSGSALPTETDSDGKASVRYLLGTGDRGVATVTVKFDQNFDGDFVDATDITVTRTYTIGADATATAAVSGSTGKFYVSATAAAGKSVVVKVAGKFVTSFKANASKKTVAVKATAGSKKVTVYVGGKLVATKTVSVK